MIKKLFFLLLFCHISLAQNTDYYEQNQEFKGGDTAYLFGNDVKLRTAPNTTSEVITLMKIGESIQIVEKTSEHMPYEGMESPWYKVIYNGETGYVLGGLLSVDKIAFGNLNYLFAFKKDDYKRYIRTRVIGGFPGYKENVSLLATPMFSVKAFDNKGIGGVESIFHINYMAEACGVDGGGIYLFYDGNQLVKAFDYTQVGDSGIYSYIEQYQFPTDQGGTPGKIYYKKSVTDIIDEATQWTKETVETRLLEWKDGQIVKPEMP